MHRRPKTPGAALAAAVALLLFAAALRLAGLGHGQPDMTYFPSYTAAQMIPENTALHPDEFHQVFRPLQMLLRRQLHPHFFENPNFLINLNFVVYALTGADNGLTLADRENIDGTERDIGAREYAAFRLYFQSRVFSALGGLLAVAAAYALARLTARSAFAGLAAGLLVAVSLPMVQHAHYATTSSLAAGFAAVSVWAALAALRVRDGRRHLWLFALGGITAGLAAGSRYNAAAVSLVVFFAGWVILYRGRTRHSLRTVLAGWALFPLSFLATTPYLLRDPQKFIEDFRYISNQYAAEGATAALKWAGLYYEYRYLVLLGIGIPAALAVLVGLWAAWRARPARAFLTQNSAALDAALMLLFLLPYSAVVLRTVRPNMAEQMLVPVIPLFAVLAGLGADWLIRRVPLASRFTMPVLIVMLVVMPLAFTLPAVRLFTLPDTREIMAAWITEHLPHGAVVHLTGAYNVALDPAHFTVSQTFYGAYPTPDELALPDEDRPQGADYVVLSDALLFDDLVNPTVTPELKAFTRDYLARYNALPALARIERPTWPGYDWFMNSMRIWRSPALTVYCLSEAACRAAR